MPRALTLRSIRSAGARRGLAGGLGVPATVAEAGQNVDDFQTRIDTKNKALTIRIANGDHAAWLEALRSTDPDFHLIGAIYIHNNPDLAVLQQLTPAEYQYVFDRPVTQESWWRSLRTDLALRAMFIPGAGSYGRVTGDGNVVLPDAAGNNVTYGNVFTDLAFDFGALTAYVKTLAAANPNIGAAAAATTATQPIHDDAAAAPSPSNFAPSGWRGPIDDNGEVGWWAPDGKFYAGASPWVGYKPGVTVPAYDPAAAPADPTPAAAAGAMIDTAATPARPPRAVLVASADSDVAVSASDAGGGSVPTGTRLTLTDSSGSATAEENGNSKWPLIIGIGVIGVGLIAAVVKRKRRRSA